MSKHSEDAGEAAPEVQVAWKTLDLFRVRVQGKEYANAPLYANGYQQLPVEVSIRALDAQGARVLLSASQLNSIKLIDTADDSELVADPSRNEFEYNWPVSFDESQGKVVAAGEGSDGASDGVQSVMKYLRLARSTNVLVAAKIISPDNVVYQSNRKFDSWILATVVPPAHFGPGSVILEREDAVSSMFVDIDLYYIGLAHTNRIARMQIMSSEAGEPHYRQQGSGSWISRTHIGYSLGDRRSVKYPASGNDERAPWFTINKYPGKVTVARISNTFDSYPSISRNLYMVIWDQNGNTASITVRPSSDGNTMSIEVSKAGADAENDEAAGAA